jgi:hypothetical protein
MEHDIRVLAGVPDDPFEHLAREEVQLGRPDGRGRNGLRGEVPLGQRQRVEVVDLRVRDEERHAGTKPLRADRIEGLPGRREPDDPVGFHAAREEDEGDAGNEVSGPHL